ncbi:MAG: hypothetical protein IT352_17100 [Gemmatimonadales bacterium]|nr:hypothetical protein [Gemmatimonadales bacterium]
MTGAFGRLGLQEQVSRKDPTVAGVLSWILPGAGQFYNGQSGKGILFLLGYSVSLGVAVAGANTTCDYDGFEFDCRSNNGLLYGGAIAALVIDIWSIVDGVSSAKKINRGTTRQGKGVVLFENGSGALQIQPIVEAGRVWPGLGVSIAF